MLYIEDIVKDKSFDKIKLLAGEKGILNVTNAVTVLEVPNIVDWLVGGESLITSLYSLQDIESQCELIKKLKEKNVACLIIKTGSYVKSIDKKVLEVADSLSFPIFEMDYSLTYVELIKMINNKLNEAKNKEYKLHKLFRDILYDYNLQTHRLLNEGKDMGIDFKNKYIKALYISYDEENMKDSDFNCKNLYEEIHISFKESKVFKLNENVVKLETYEGLIIFILTDDEYKNVYIEEEIIKIITSICKCKIGISETGRKIEFVKKSFEMARISNSIGSIVKRDKNIYNYKDIYVYKVWFSSRTEDIYEYVDEVLKDVIDDKILMKTLDEYFTCNENIKMASRNLNIHYNTLRYRLDQVKEKTGKDVFNIHEKFELYMAILGSKMVYNLKI